MAKKESGPRRKEPAAVAVQVRLAGRRPDEEAPELSVYRITPGGDIDRKLARVEKGKFKLQRSWLKLGGYVALGPEVEDPGDLRPEALQQFRLKQVWAEWTAKEEVVVARPVWEGWLMHRVCVSGSARWCRRWLLEAGDRLRLVESLVNPAMAGDRPLRKASYGNAISGGTLLYDRKFTANAERLRDERYAELISPMICRPLCRGVVEVYERVCCCRPWVVLDPRLDELLERLKDEICRVIPCPRDPWPPDPWPPEREPDPFPPGPDPGPFAAGPWPPEPDLFVGDRLTQRQVKKVAAGFDPAALRLPPARLMQDYRTLASYAAVDRAEADLYIMERPYLLRFFCHCSTRKIGEAIINPDGSFMMCYWRPLMIHRFGTHCTTTYGFRIRQRIDNQWIQIYDGVGQDEFFDEEDSIVLRSFDPRAWTCETNPPPVPGEGLPFVLLEDIGSTRTHHLVSPVQTAVDGLNTALPANGGLVFPPGPGETAEKRLRNRPWSMTLSLRLYVHPEMKPLGAKYYRFSVVAADSMGNPMPGAVPQPLTDGVTWRRYIDVAGEVQVHGEALGPDSVVDGDGEVQAGLYLIPYWDDDHQWLYGQFHHRWNTLAHADGRYLLSVEIFDAAGNRLRPNGAGGAGVDKNFHFLRWVDSVHTQQVPYAALQHVFWIDKQACYADIEDLRKDGLASTSECQFMTGAADSTFSGGYRAFHRNGPPGETFLWFRHLWYHRGLNGPNRTIEHAGDNAPATLDAGPPAVSTPQTFLSMLDDHPKCTFALNLRTRAKHTNGSRRIHEYDRYDQAAFALEIGT